MQFFVIIWTFVETNLTFIYCSHEELYKCSDR